MTWFIVPINQDIKFVSLIRFSKTNHIEPLSYICNVSLNCQNFCKNLTKLYIFSAKNTVLSLLSLGLWRSSHILKLILPPPMVMSPAGGVKSFCQYNLRTVWGKWRNVEQLWARSLISPLACRPFSPLSRALVTYFFYGDFYFSCLPLFFGAPLRLLSPPWFFCLSTVMNLGSVIPPKIVCWSTVVKLNPFWPPAILKSDFRK